MSRSTSSTVYRESNDETWPWECLHCGTTIYHDGEYCRECESRHVFTEDNRWIRGLRAFLRWMRRESHPSFVLKTTSIASVELTLTAFWLQLMLVGPTELMREALHLL